MPKTVLNILIALSFVALAACSPKQVSPGDPDDQAMHETRHTESASYYYDFDDILVPRAMTLQPRQSFVMETPQVKAGLLTFKGRVDAVSLTSFFINNMLKDGWKLSSSFKYRRTVLVFTKPDRDCIINILDERFNTLLEIWITPKGDRVTGADPLQAPARSERILTQ